MQQRPQYGDRISQLQPEGFDVGNGIGQSRSAWLKTREAAVYVGRSLAGFRAWAKRRGLVAVDGCYARREIDKARAVPRKRHAMSAVSLSNLRHGQQRTERLALIAADRDGFVMVERFLSEWAAFHGIASLDLAVQWVKDAIRDVTRLQMAAGSARMAKAQLPERAREKRTA